MSLKVPKHVYARDGDVVLFRQVGVKIGMDGVPETSYWAWLDEMTGRLASLVAGAKIVEKPNARVSPPLNTAIYYDTKDHRIVPTGALLRTSCNVVTHAFCAFKDSQDVNGVRDDHRYVFAGEEKLAIQRAPSSAAAVAIVKRLLRRTDIAHPGVYLERAYGIRGEDLEPAVCLEDLRYTFFVWLDGKDALRCSLDRYSVSDLRLPEGERVEKPLAEVELSIYPRIEPEVAKDCRVIDLIHTLQNSLCKEFSVSSTTEIKYQRSAKALGLDFERPPA
jgi:hypothetical protein